MSPFPDTTGAARWTPLPALENQGCFACGPTNPHGLRMRFGTDGECLMSRITVAEHLCGWSRLVHGGVISAIHDEIMSWAAIYLLKRVILTRSLSVEFRKPVFVNTPLRAEGRVREIRSPREAVMAADLVAEDTGRVCSRAEGVFALLTPDTAKKLSVVDDRMLQDLEPLLNGEPIRFASKPA